MKPIPITVELDRAREIAWSNRARYRLGTLPSAPKFGDLLNESRSYATLCAYLWAMLVDRRTAFASPEELADHIHPDRFAGYVDSLLQAINAAEDTPKNAPGSTPSLSPASSSD